MQQYLMYKVTDVDTLAFAEKVYLISLKSDFDKLDIDELKIIPNRLNNLKTDIDELDITTLQTISVHLKKWSEW